ncbi:hypothetical protein D516_2688 [Rhodobacter sp. AKP1]|nr:hypothetical protein D516_2688 [Rhodobacter sp. AKP1]
MHRRFSFRPVAHARAPASFISCCRRRAGVRGAAWRAIALRVTAIPSQWSARRCGRSRECAARSRSLARSARRLRGPAPRHRIAPPGARLRPRSSGRLVSASCGPPRRVPGRSARGLCEARHFRAPPVRTP